MRTLEKFKVRLWVAAILCQLYLLPTSALGIHIETRIPVEGQVEQQWIVTVSDGKMQITEGKSERLGAVVRVAADISDLGEDWLEGTLVLLKDGSVIATPLSAGTLSANQRTLEELSQRIADSKATLATLASRMDEGFEVPAAQDTVSDLENVKSQIRTLEQKIAQAKANKS